MISAVLILLFRLCLFGFIIPEVEIGAVGEHSEKIGSYVSQAPHAEAASKRDRSTPNSAYPDVLYIQTLVAKPSTYPNKQMLPRLNPVYFIISEFNAAQTIRSWVSNKHWLAQDINSRLFVGNLGRGVWGDLISVRNILNITSATPLVVRNDKHGADVGQVIRDLVGTYSVITKTIEIQFRKITVSTLRLPHQFDLGGGSVGGVSRCSESDVNQNYTDNAKYHGNGSSVKHPLSPMGGIFLRLQIPNFALIPIFFIGIGLGVLGFKCAAYAAEANRDVRILWGALVALCGGGIASGAITYWLSIGS